MKHILHKKAKHFVSILLGLVIMVYAAGCNKPKLAGAPDISEVVDVATTFIDGTIAKRADIATDKTDEELRTQSYLGERFDLCWLDEDGSFLATNVY